jgi:hypothetical protein
MNSLNRRGKWNCLYPIGWFCKFCGSFCDNGMDLLIPETFLEGSGYDVEKYKESCKRICFHNPDKLWEAPKEQGVK